MAYGKYMI